MEVGESTLATRFYDVTDDLPRILFRVSPRLSDSPRTNTIGSLLR